MKSKKLYLGIFVLLVEMTLGITPFVDSFFNINSISFSNLEIISAQASILILYIAGLKVIDSENISFLVDKYAKTSSDVNRLLNTHSEVHALTEEDFYSLFLQKINESNHIVYTCHLGDKPPVSLRGTNADQYYKKYFSLVTKKHNIVFKRIELVSKDKLDWIDEYISKTVGKNNFSLSIIASDGEDKTTPYMSTQLIDDESVFLVAISKHQDRHKIRDIYIKDKSASVLFLEYYENKLSKIAIPIIENGYFDTDKWEGIKKQLLS